VLPVRLDPTGKAGPTPRQAAGTRWRQTSRGYYVPAWVDGTNPHQRIIEASVLVPEGGAITGWPVLHVHRARWSDGTTADGSIRDVPVITPGHCRRSQRGLAFCAESLRSEDVEVRRGVRFTTAVHAVLFEICRADHVREAVRWIDVAAAADLVSLEELRRHIELFPRRPGIRQAREAAALGVENCWSPTETEMRLIWQLDLGIDGLLCNHPVFDLDGRHIGTPDLIDVEAGLVGEYDSELHWEKRSGDLEREAAFRRVGLEYVAMATGDRADPTAVKERTEEARSRALAAAGSPRSWTVEPPRWWTPTVTVAQRRRLAGWERERYLRWQAA
jgi:hypothetical protein